MQSSPRQRCRALTLVELVVSTLIAAILVSGMASAILIATRALPENSAELNGPADAADAAELIASELLCATSVTSLSDTGITFTVADRDGDDAPETIQYKWSGVAGDPLQRSYNGATAGALVDEVHDFELISQMRTDGSGNGGGGNDDTELVSWVGDDGSSSDAPIDADEWYGQLFTPDLPDDTERWYVTEAWVRLRRDGAAEGVVGIELWKGGTGGLPSLERLAQATLPESMLDSDFQWVGVTFPGDPELDPTDSACLLVTKIGGSGTVARIQYEGGGVGLSGAGLLRYDGWWNLETDKALRFIINGYVETTSGNTGTTWLAGMTIRLQVGGDQAEVTETAVPLLNLPEVN